MFCLRLISAIAVAQLATSALAVDAMARQGARTTAEPTLIVGIGLVSLALLSLRRRRA